MCNILLGNITTITVISLCLKYQKIVNINLQKVTHVTLAEQVTSYHRPLSICTIARSTDRNTSVN